MRKITGKILITALLMLMVLCVCGSEMYGSQKGTRYSSAALEERQKTVFSESEDIMASAAEQIEIRRKELEMEERRSRHVLVNKDHPLPEDYEVKLIKISGTRHKAAEEAFEPLCTMLKEAKEEGIRLTICSSYRDAAYQKRLFDEDVARYMSRGYSYDTAYEKTMEYTMPPGYSEHSTGLAFDIVSSGYHGLTLKQEKTRENKWLREHCAEYGFILRYPKDKEEITKIRYESWHFRYVGVEAAEYIMKNGITLEEYLEVVE